MNVKPMNVKHRPMRRCPICGRPPVVGLLPFCSNRCADADLSRWLTGGYAVPGEEAEDTQSSGLDRDEDFDREN